MQPWVEQPGYARDVDMRWRGIRTRTQTSLAYSATLGIRQMGVTTDDPMGMRSTNLVGGKSPRHGGALLLRGTVEQGAHATCSLSAEHSAGKQARQENGTAER